MSQSSLSLTDFLDSINTVPSDLGSISSDDTEPALSVVSGNTVRLRSAFLTIFFEDGKSIDDDIIQKLKPVGYSGQYEICPETSQLHYHLYIRFSNPQRFNRIQNWGKEHGFKNINVKGLDRKSKVEHLKCARYAVKQRTRAPNTEPTIWGNFGKKQTLQDFISHGISKSNKKNEDKGPSDKDQKSAIVAIVKQLMTHDLHFDCLVRSIDNADKELSEFAQIHSDVLKKLLNYEAALRVVDDNTNQGIIARIGCAGTGKSYDTLSFLKKYTENAGLENLPVRAVCHVYQFGEKFQNYSNQPFLHLPEFGGRNSLPLEQFKLMANIGYKGSDQYGSFMRKNTTPIFYNFKNVLLDSNVPLTAMYKNMFEDNEEHWNAFIRRFQEVRYYPACRLVPEPSHPTDFLVQDGQYVSNKFDTTTNPSPSWFDVLPLLDKKTYSQAVSFFSAIDSSSKLGTSVSTIRPTNLSWELLRHKCDFFMNKPVFILKKEIEYRVEFKDDDAMMVIIRSFLDNHEFPEIFYSVETRRWTVEIPMALTEPELPVIDEDSILNDDLVLNLRGGGGNNDVATMQRAHTLRVTKDLIIDIIGPTYAWPRSISTKFIHDIKLDNRERFSLTVFFLCNGLNPELLEDYLDCFDYDSNARGQVRWIVQQYPSSQWKAWNVAMSKSM